LFEALWNEMGKVKERAKELGIWDAVAVYRDLARGNALQFCALVRAVPPPTVLRPPPLPSRKEEKVMANVDTLVWIISCKNPDSGLAY
jgi:hypothetical protein